ncbi:MAG: DUF58 domain-containing protein [Chloroflexi bacterium]|nr:DUF58 domain-containing protein [Chloroflexota bacterium]
MLTLTGGWLVTFGLLAFLGLMTGHGILVGLGALVLLTWAVAWSWNRASLARVLYERQVTPTRAFVGEEVHVRLQLTNRKALPLPWIRLEENFPSGLVPLGKAAPLRVEQRTYPVSRATSLARHERVTWHYTFQCQERGLYRFGPARVSSGDVFGFFTTERDEPRQSHVLVFPQTLPLPALGLPARRPFGEVRRGLPFAEDPTRLRALREHRPDDPLRRVDWKATARAQALQVRVFDPSVSHTLAILLNVETLAVEEAHWGYSPLLLERGVTAAASIARWALDQRYSVGLLTNSISPLTEQAIRILPSRNPRQLTAVLEALAVVGPLYHDSMAEFLVREARRLPAGISLVLVTASLPSSLADALQEVQHEGYQPCVVWVNEERPEGLPEEVSLFAIGREMARLEAESPFRPRERMVGTRGGA